MFDARHAGFSKSIKRSVRQNLRRAFVVITAVSLISIAVASGGLLTAKRIVPTAHAQADNQPPNTPKTQLPSAPQQDQNGQLSLQAIQQIVALEAEKQNRTPTEQKIDSQLLQAVRESRGQQMTAGVNLAPAQVGSDTNGRVKVDIAAAVTDDLIIRIESLGGQVIFPSWQYHTIRAEVSLSAVEAIAGYAEVRFIGPAVGSMTSDSVRGAALAPRALDPMTVIATGTGDSFRRSMSRPNFAERAARVRAKLSDALANRAITMPLPTGSVNSEGDRTHRADDARNTFGFAGQGIRIGVLSDSYNATGGAPADIASGNLPGAGNPIGNTTPVTVLQDLSGSGSDEGRAMLQIVHDLAPKAQLFFATADVSEASFASNILALRNAPNNCDIIIDDVFYFDESPFQDGIVAQAVNTVTAGGAWYFSSAGNEGNVAKSTAGYFEGDFSDAGSPAFTFPGGAKTGTIHNFGTVGSPINGDIITAATPNAYTLSWTDPAGVSNNDYDLFVVSSGGTVKASSTNIQNGTQNPFELIAPIALALGDRLVVFKTTTAAVRAFSINALRGRLTINTIGQTHGHSATVNAFSVGATPAAAPGGTSAPGPFPGAFTAANQVETFTSDGPRRVFFNGDGTAITPGNFLFGTNGGTVRNKPDITAADGVVTTLPSASGLNPFYGTSAAAPHAGAIAALLKSANNALTPAQIRTFLTTNTVDIESAGYDNLSGFGIIQAFQTMQALSPTPQATVQLGTVTQTEGSFKNNNGFVDPGELGNLTIQLTNPSLVNATSVNATLTTGTSGISIVEGSASYGTVNSSGNATNPSPFVFAVNSSVPCGTTISFTLTVTFGGGFSPQVFQFSTVVGNQPYTNINSTLGSTPPTLSGVTSITGTQTGRLTRNGVASVCGTQKPNPGLAAATGSRAFDAYTFTNTGATDQCVQVTVTAANGLNLYCAAYNSAGFVPANPGTNFLADSGTSGPTQTFSFTAPAGQSFTIVVHEVNVGSAVGSAYNLNVSLTNCAAGPVCPANFVVANNGDNGTGSLRETLGIPCAGTTLTFAPGVNSITLTSGELPISRAVTINGPGAKSLTISGNNASRIFDINAGAAAVSISGMTLTNGKPVGGVTGGGAILINNGAAVGAVNLTGLQITNNDVSLAGNPLGGGIDNEGGTVTIDRCSIVNNTATFRSGGVQNQGFGSMVITNSTIANNTAGTTGLGGGIRSLLNLTLTNVTIFGNSAQTGGNISNSAGTITFGNTIIAGGTLVGSGGSGPDVNGAGTFSSADYNLIQDTSTATIGGTTTHNITGVNPNLLTLANYGGPTSTLIPQINSPVINAGDPALVSGTDQRGFPRLVGTHADIGAVEANFALNTSAGTPQSTTIKAAFATALQAKVTESTTNPVSGAAVTFTAPSSGASGTFPGNTTTATVNTDLNGFATAPTFTANGTAGGYLVVASAAGGLTTNFSLSNLQATTTTALVSSVNPSDFGQVVTFTATVTSGAGTPTGTVQFKDNGANLGPAVTLNIGGTAQFTTSTLTVGNHPITADYSGDPNFLASSGTLSGGQVVKPQPSLSINDVSTTEGQSGTKPLNFTVTLSAASNLTVTVNYATANGTATAPSDYVAVPSTLLTFNPGDTTKTIPVTINGDINFEPDETFTVNLSGSANATISKASGTGTILNDDAQGGFFSFSAATYNVNESDGVVTVTVTRTNDVSQAANVDYATDDTGASANCAALNTGLASQRCDYTPVSGTFKFAANETQKTVDIPINLDAYTEGPENFSVKLSNPTNGGVLFAPSTATVTINDSTSPTPNAIDDTTTFVRQQYRDFLNRDADSAGLAFWKDNIDKCNDPARRPPGLTLAQCVETQRIITSAAFFLSIEFMQTGTFVRSFYVASLNRPATNSMPAFTEWLRDTQAVQRGVIVGRGNWPATLDANRLAFMQDFVARPEFVGLYPTTDTPTQYINKLYSHALSRTPTTTELNDGLSVFGGAATASDPTARGQALLKVTQASDFVSREVPRAFVQFEYFGYLRRNPNDAPDNNFNGYNFWLNKLIQFNGDFLQAEMVKAFLSSGEYRQRFGP